jgi:hypothetical protein
VKILVAMMMLGAVPLAGCTTSPGAKVKAAKVRRNAVGCVEHGWMTAGMRYPTAGQIHAYARHRDNHAVNPPPTTPDIGRIERQCQ